MNYLISSSIRIDFINSYGKRFNFFHFTLLNVELMESIHDEEDSVSQKGKLYRYMDEEEGKENLVSLEDNEDNIEVVQVESKLVWTTVLVYACGELGVSVGNTLYGLFFTTFMLEVTKLEPSYVSSLIPCYTCI